MNGAFRFAGLALGLFAGGGALWYVKRVDHNHPNGFGVFGGGRQIEAIIEHNGHFYEVWGLVCECGYVEPDGFCGVYPSVGPATGWTRDDITDMILPDTFDNSIYRDHIIDVRSENFRPKN